MYGRNINFTLLAPSLWAVVEAIASNVEEDKYKRMLFKTGENSGFIIEVFDKSVRDLYQADLVLVRPDQVVVWRGNNGNCIDVVLDQVTGH